MTDIHLTAFTSEKARLASALASQATKTGKEEIYETIQGYMNSFITSEVT